MVDVPRISDVELDQIEFEIDDLYMEQPVINAIQLKAIIGRLRYAERAVALAVPFVQRSADRTKLRELNETFGWMRLGALVLGLLAGTVGVSFIFFLLQPIEPWMVDSRLWLFLGTVAIGFLLPFGATTFPLLRKVDRKVRDYWEKENG